MTAFTPTPQRPESRYFDESGLEYQLDTEDYALIPSPSDGWFYALLALILVGSTALFGASAYMLLG